MDLTVYERIALLQVLPVAHQHGSFIKQKTLLGLIGDLGFTEHELIAWDIQQEGERITWDETRAEPKALELGPVATGLVLDALRWLDEQERMDIGLLPLCEKFGYTGPPESGE